MNKILIGLFLGLILLVVGCTPSNKHNFRGRDFQIDENTKREIISFFESTTEIDEIKSYCEENRMYCSYFCKEINPNHEICDNLLEKAEGRERPTNRSYLDEK